jgi:hypothetical protein
MGSSQIWQEAIADLIGVEDVPAKSPLRVSKKCLALTGKEFKWCWDRCSVPQIMHHARDAASSGNFYC